LLHVPPARLRSHRRQELISLGNPVGPRRDDFTFLLQRAHNRTLNTRPAITLLLLALSLAPLSCARKKSSTPSIAAPTPPGAVVRPRTPDSSAPFAAASTKSSRDSNSIPRPLEPRLDAVRGRTLVIPLDAPRSARLPAALPLRLDDGRVIDAPVFWIGATPSAAPRHLWLPDPGRWSATPAFAPPPPESSLGAWCALVDLPEDPGLGLWFARTRIPINPIAEPSIIAPTALPWNPTAGPQSANLTLNLLARPDAASPLRRWRYELLTEGLAPIFPFQPATSGGRDSDRALEALAQQFRARWQVALAWLFIHNPDLSLHLRRRLASAVIMDSEHVAPICPATDSELATLLSSLLDPTLSPPDRADRAQAFLDALPVAIATVLDDAGQFDARTSAPVSTAMLINLARRPAVAYLTDSADEQPPSLDLEPLAPASARTLAAVAMHAAPIRALAAPRPASFTAHIAEWKSPLDALPAPIPIAPPGLRLDPFALDWTMDAFLHARPDASMIPGPLWSTAALLFRDDSDSNPWRLLIECAFDPADKRTEDHIELWLGPYHAPVCVLSINRSGVVSILKGALAETPAPFIERADSRWSALISIPASAIDRAGLLRLSVLRVDPRGFRAAWPRPMLPWQEEPGRLSINTTTWAGATLESPR
jgi:hypothetical protein